MKTTELLALLTILLTTTSPRMSAAGKTEPDGRRLLSVLRRFMLEDRKRLVVEDEISARQPAELWWFLHTEARVGLSN